MPSFWGCRCCGPPPCGGCWQDPVADMSDANWMHEFPEQSEIEDVNNYGLNPVPLLGPAYGWQVFDVTEEPSADGLSRKLHLHCEGRTNSTVDTIAGFCIARKDPIDVEKYFYPFTFNTKLSVRGSPSNVVTLDGVDAETILGPGSVQAFVKCGLGSIFGGVPDNDDFPSTTSMKSFPNLFEIPYRQTRWERKLFCATTRSQHRLEDSLTSRFFGSGLLYAYQTYYNTDPSVPFFAYTLAEERRPNWSSTRQLIFYGINVPGGSSTHIIRDLVIDAEVEIRGVEYGYGSSLSYDGHGGYFFPVSDADYYPVKKVWVWGSSGTLSNPSGPTMCGGDYFPVDHQDFSDSADGRAWINGMTDGMGNTIPSTYGIADGAWSESPVFYRGIGEKSLYPGGTNFTCKLTFEPMQCVEDGERSAKITVVESWEVLQSSGIMQRWSITDPVIDAWNLLTPEAGGWLDCQDQAFRDEYTLWLYLSSEHDPDLPTPPL